MNRLNALTLMALLAPIAAAQKNEPAAFARDVEPFLDDLTFLVVHADLATLDIDAHHRWLEKLDAKLAKELLPVRDRARKLLGDVTAAGGKRVYVVVSLADVPQDGPFVVFPLDKDADADGLIAALKRIEGLNDLVYEKRDGVLVGATARVMKRLKGMKVVPRPELGRALGAIDPGAAVAVFMPPAILRRSIEETLPALPKEIGGGSTKLLTRGVAWVTVAYDAPPKLVVRLTIQASDAGAARELETLAKRSLHLIATSKEIRTALPDLPKLFARLPLRADGDRLTLTIDNDFLAGVAVPAMKNMTVAADAARSMQNLRNIGEALHTYHDRHNSLPAAASTDKQGKPLLSWRVHLLPYCEEQALYKQFKLDEPWDSEHNKKLITRMPKLYASSPNAALAREGKTTYLAPVGKDTAFPGSKGVRIQDITDGASNTILLIDADDARAVAWTKPDDFAIDLDKPMAGMRMNDERGFLTLLVDGSVRRVSPSIDKASLKAMFTIAGNEMVSPP